MKNNWINLFTTQFLGVLNDNLLKSLICFVSIYWVSPENKALIIALSSATMVLPFILLSPLAGYLSQIHDKRRILELAKLVEIPIMLVALFGFLANSLGLVLFSMLCMGIQSALYSPSKYGLIKEFSNAENISKKLGIMEMLSFVAVLSGTLFAGFIADLSKFQLSLIGLSLVSISIIGWLASKKIAFTEILLELKPVKNLNPITFIFNTHKTAKKYKGVNAAIFGLAGFWFIASLMQMNLLVHCPETLGLSSTQTGLVSAMVAIGIGLGCWVSGLINKKRLEMGLVIFAGLGLTLSTALLTAASLDAIQFMVVLTVSAFFGGLFKVPLNVWTQQRTEGKDVGNILAYSNMLVFLAILISAAIFSALQFNFSSHQIFGFTAVVSAILTLIAFIKMPVAMVRFTLWVISKILYRAKLNGTKNIPLKSGGILVANHVSLLDALFMVAAAPRNMQTCYILYAIIWCVNK